MKKDLEGKIFWSIFGINARKDAEKQIYGNFLEWYENCKKWG